MAVSLNQGPSCGCPYHKSPNHFGVYIRAPDFWKLPYACFYRAFHPLRQLVTSIRTYVVEGDTNFIGCFAWIAATGLKLLFTSFLWVVEPLLEISSSSWLRTRTPPGYAISYVMHRPCWLAYHGGYLACPSMSWGVDRPKSLQPNEFLLTTLKGLRHTKKPI